MENFLAYFSSALREKREYDEKVKRESWTSAVFELLVKSGSQRGMNAEPEKDKEGQRLKERAGVGGRLLGLSFCSAHRVLTSLCFSESRRKKKGCIWLTPALCP